MSDLISTNYNYVYNDLVLVRATAKNEYGWATSTSDTNSVGAMIRTVPIQMSTPVRLSSTTTNSIELSWSPLTTDADTGGSTILSYNL